MYYTAQKMKFFIKYFSSKCEDILNGKLYFLFSAIQFYFNVRSVLYNFQNTTLHNFYKHCTLQVCKSWKKWKINHILTLSISWLQLFQNWKIFEVYLFQIKNRNAKNNVVLVSSLLTLNIAKNCFLRNFLRNFSEGLFQIAPLSDCFC